jgi:hypothetical protein
MLSGGYPSAVLSMVKVLVPVGPSTSWSMIRSPGPKNSPGLGIGLRIPAFWGKSMRTRPYPSLKTLSCQPPTCLNKQMGAGTQ